MLDEFKQVVDRWESGDRTALDEMLPFVYAELKRLARVYLRGERPAHTLQPTALVHEAYLRLVDQDRVDCHTRAQFFGIAANLMRQILVNYALSYNAQKRGGGAQKIELDEVALVADAQSKEVVELNEALDRLGALDPRKAQVVELKYFGGLNYEEIAEVLKISRITVRRDWEFAKVWLYTELHDAT